MTPPAELAQSVQGSNLVELRRLTRRRAACSFSFFVLRALGLRSRSLPEARLDALAAAAAVPTRFEATLLERWQAWRGGAELPELRWLGREPQA